MMTWTFNWINASKIESTVHGDTSKRNLNLLKSFFFFRCHYNTNVSKLACLEWMWYCGAFHIYFKRQCFRTWCSDHIERSVFVSHCSNSAILPWLHKTPTHTHSPTHACSHKRSLITRTSALTHAVHLSSVSLSTPFHCISIQAVL